MPPSSNARHDRIGLDDVFPHEEPAARYACVDARLGLSMDWVVEGGMGDESMMDKGRDGERDGGCGFDGADEYDALKRDKADLLVILQHVPYQPCSSLEKKAGSVEGPIVQIVRNIPISCGPGIVKFEHASCHGIVFLVPSSTLDKETAVLGDLTTAHRAADLGLWVSTQNLTVVPVVEPKTLGRASFSGGSFYHTSGAFLTTPPLHISPAASPATSYPTRHGCR
ncbi:hypothetical protein BJ165DRAFT_1530754 [Panaeolus papilionaceus]|nr:hypothetical protein BJ165DRAFT_1530754 [Panaeolus papilionaceus]